MRKRRLQHDEFIAQQLARFAHTFRSCPTLIECGCGVSTRAIVNAGFGLQAKIVSIDYNSEKINHLRQKLGEAAENCEFIIGDSVEILLTLVQKLERIDFLFLDSAASAIHTFREFLTVEKCLFPGAVVIVDNAALPGEANLLSPVRKGKILVPYLLAHPFWKVESFPDVGDSMILASMQKEGKYSDPTYEDPHFIDNWAKNFKRAFD